MRAARHWSAAAVRPFLFGLLSGFLLLGPSSFMLFVAAQHTSAGPLIPPLSIQVAPQAGLPAPLLLAQVRAANRNKRAILIGSSEFRGEPAVPALLGALETPNNRAPFTSGFRGSAVWRAVIDLEQLSNYNYYPRRLIIVVNPYYAHDNAEPIARAWNAYFPDRATGALHRCHFAGSPPANCSTARQALFQIEAFRELLARAVVVPTTRVWQFSGSGEHREQGKINASQAEPNASQPAGTAPGAAGAPGRSLDRVLTSDYGRSLFGLAEQLRKTPTTCVTLLLLPLNRPAYGDKKQPVHAQERDFVEGTRAIIGDRAIIEVLDSLRDPRLFTDAVHFTGAGRLLLAREILRAQEQTCSGKPGP